MDKAKFMTDTMRVELAIPACLLNAVAHATLRAMLQNENPTALGIVGKAKEASLEPLRGLTPDKAGKLARRVERSYQWILDKYDDKTTTTKVAMILFFFVEVLQEEGCLTLYAGSPFADSFKALIALFEEQDKEGWESRRVEESAKKQAWQIVDHLRAQGLYAWKLPQNARAVS